MSKLTLDLQSAYLSFIQRDTPADREQFAGRFADPDWLARRRVRLDGADVIASLSLSPIGGDELQLHALQAGGRPVSVDDAALIAEVMQYARKANSSAVLSRIPVDQLSAAYQEALETAGFKQTGTRIEYKTLLSELSGDGGSPMSWAPPAELDAAASLLARCSEGDPDGLEPDVDPREVLDGYLSAPGLTVDPARCIHIGSLDGAVAAFVCAQVDPRDGWSRITYMGLLPGFRGQRLGSWVHRHGLAMLKAQGGVLYHGGTRQDNVPMKACFARQGCREVSRLSEWAWSRA